MCLRLLTRAFVCPLYQSSLSGEIHSDRDSNQSVMSNLRVLTHSAVAINVQLAQLTISVCLLAVLLQSMSNRHSWQMSGLSSQHRLSSREQYWTHCQLSWDIARATTNPCVALCLTLDIKASHSISLLLIFKKLICLSTLCKPWLPKWFFHWASPKN